MIPSLPRVTAIWSGVGLGHLAVLGWIWGAAGAPASRADGFVLVTLVAEQRAVAPLSRVAALPPPAPLAAVPLPMTPLPEAPSVAPVVEAPPARALAAPSGAARPRPPEFLHRVEPGYPRAARLAGVEGVVRLRLGLDAAGRLVSAEVAESSGSASLDRAALEAAKASRYAPARLGAEAIPAETEAAYRFRLR
jgi:protein TonB